MRRRHEPRSIASGKSKPQNGGNDDATKETHATFHAEEGGSAFGGGRDHLHGTLALQPGVCRRLGQADCHRSHLGRLGAVRQLGRVRSARHADGRLRAQRARRRARAQGRDHPHRHRDNAGDGQPGGGTPDRPPRMRLPHRRGQLGGRERHLPGRPEVRHRVPEHQLQLAHRIRQELPPRQVRLGRKRHQLRPGRGQERDQRLRNEVDADDQRLRLGPQHLGRDPQAGPSSTAPRSSTRSSCRRARGTSAPCC